MPLRAIDEDILRHLRDQGPSTARAIREAMPQYTSHDVGGAVNKLRQQGMIESVGHSQHCHAWRLVG